MMMEKDIISTWNPVRCKLTTKLKGSISLDDVELWKMDLLKASSSIDRPFTFIFDNCDFHAASMEVHRAYRDVVPRLLARHGLILSLLTEEEKNLVSREYDSSLPECKAMALVHHYRYKMETLDREYKRENQRYFFNIEQAEEWIDGFHHYRHSSCTDSTDTQHS